MSQQPLTLHDFILHEMKVRNMSMRQFATLVGVVHSTIVRAVDPIAPSPPSFEFLVKLAKATHTDIKTIAAIAAPDAVLDSTTDILILATRISRLSENQRKLIDAAISGIVFQSEDSARGRQDGAFGRQDGAFSTQDGTFGTQDSAGDTRGTQDGAFGTQDGAFGTRDGADGTRGRQDSTRGTQEDAGGAKDNKS